MKPNIHLEATMAYDLDTVLIDKGLVPNEFILRLNQFLTVPTSFNLDGFWSYPSAMFRFPITYDKGQLSVCMEPMKNHPYVIFTEHLLGQPIPVSDGVSHGRRGTWGHAMDLLARDLVDELEETIAFTDLASIEDAIGHYVCWSKGCDASPLTIKEARLLMRRFGISEPARDDSWIRRLSKPSSLRGEDGPERWPVNAGADRKRASAWAHIHAIEGGYFTTKSGHLEWTAAGREYFEGNSFGLLF